MCTVVQHLTHDFGRLVALVKSCNGTTVRVPKDPFSPLDIARLQQAIARPVAQQMTPIEARTLSILIFIVSLLGEHCNFDRLRLENAGKQYNFMEIHFMADTYPAAFAADLNLVSKVLLCCTKIGPH